MGAYAAAAVEWAIGVVEESRAGTSAQRAAARSRIRAGFEGLGSNPDPRDAFDTFAHLLLAATDLVAGERRAELHRRIVELETELRQMIIREAAARSRRSP